MEGEDRPAVIGGQPGNGGESEGWIWNRQNIRMQKNKQMGSEINLVDRRYYATKPSNQMQLGSNRGYANQL